MSKTFMNMDERNVQVAGRVIAIMYLITILALNAAVIYRQIVLGQDFHDMEDIASILTFNSLFLISALLYFGAVTIRNLKISTLLMGYVGFVVLGSLFTYVKYNVFGDANLSLAQLLDKLFIIASICGLIVIFFTLFSILGKRRIDKALDD